LMNNKYVIFIAFGLYGIEYNICMKQIIEKNGCVLILKS
jgi:hypothetical protein